MSVSIIPAVLSKSFAEIESHLAKVADIATLVQIDVVDGVFAHGKTWPYHDEATFTKIVAEEKGLPFWDKLNFQFDLMVEHPEEVIEQYLAAGASQVLFHAGAPGAASAFQAMVDKRTNEGGAFEVQSGIALRSRDILEVLEAYEAQFDFVQVMGIENIGRQGEAFDRHALYLVERIRRRYPHLPIQVDGGVRKEYVAELVSAGVTSLVVGSAIFGSEDPAAAYKELVEIAGA